MTQAQALDAFARHHPNVGIVATMGAIHDGDIYWFGIGTDSQTGFNVILATDGISVDRYAETTTRALNEFAETTPDMAKWPDRRVRELAAQGDRVAQLEAGERGFSPSWWNSPESEWS